MRAITHRRVLGMGPLYQGRFKTLPVQEDRHLLTLQRYVGRNPVRAGLAVNAASWRWCGEGVRQRETKELTNLLSAWSVPRPRDWLRQLDEAPGDAEAKAIRESSAAAALSATSHGRRGSPTGCVWIGSCVPAAARRSSARRRDNMSKNSYVLRPL
jgi:hypothetical protein